MTAPTRNVREVGEDSAANHGPQSTALPRTEASGEPWSVAVGLSPADPARYQRLGEFARGGLGRIVKVRDLRIGRIVAVKEMRRTSEAAHARFVREARITACLEHPAIVPVHDIGRWPSGEPFYSMKLIAGRSLQDVIRDARDLDERLALLPNVIAVADAIAYAHSQGIIHRDLKPANVLVGAFGETVVIDWGLAKNLGAAGDGDPGVELEDETGERAASDDGGSLTVDGAVLGTPCYMPPEQAGGQPADQRADVYALGAMLYEVLAGTPPYQGRATPVAVLAGPPPPVETRQPMIPPDLAAVVHKAMAREPGDRYRSARELALDLRRFQTGRLVSAHAYSSRMLVQRWLRRYRAPVTVAAVALSILAAVGAVSVDRVVTERDVARRRAAQLVLAQARSTLDSDATQALASLRTYPEEGADRAALRTLAIEAAGRGVARHVQQGLLTFTADGLGWIGAPDSESLELHDAVSGRLVRRWPHHGRVGSLAAVPGTHTVAIVDDGDTAVVLFDLETGASRRLPPHPGPISVLAVSPDGRWIASGSYDGLVRLAPIRGGASRELSGHEREVLEMAFSADSRWLFSMAVEPTAARLWPVDGGEPRRLVNPSGVLHGDVSRDGALVAFAYQDGTVSLWESATDRQVKILVRNKFGMTANKVVFSPDGRWLASGGNDHQVIVTSLDTGAQRQLSGHRSAVANLAFSPDSAMIASGTNSGEVRIWEVHGDEERMLGRHPGRISYLAFSPDGRRLATGTNTKSETGDARIWDVATLHQRGLRCQGTSPFQIAFSPDGRRMAANVSDKSLALWDLATGQCQRLEGHEKYVQAFAFAPDGKRVASTSRDGTVRLWDLGPCDAIAGCKPAPRVLDDHAGAASTVAFSPDGRWLASNGNDAAIRLWDLVSGQERRLEAPAKGVWRLAFSPDGRQLAATGEDPEIWLLDVASGAPVALRGHGDRVGRVTFSSDGRSLWTSSADHTVREWQLATGTSRIVGRRLGPALTFALAPRERWIATGDGGGRVALIDPVTLAERTLGHHAAAVTGLVFSPDGGRLASVGYDGMVRLWDVEHGTLEAVFPSEFDASEIAFSPDGRSIAAWGNGPVVRIWPVPPPAAVPDDLRDLATWMARRSMASASPDARERAP
jgi:WD40 repeat protein/tRNA A-37 threonylcarbamoyl transferase component Bud32